MQRITSRHLITLLIAGTVAHRAWGSQPSKTQARLQQKVAAKSQQDIHAIEQLLKATNPDFLVIYNKYSDASLKHIRPQKELFQKIIDRWAELNSIKTSNFEFEFILAACIDDFEARKRIIPALEECKKCIEKLTQQKGKNSSPTKIQESFDQLAQKIKEDLAILAHYQALADKMAERDAFIAHIRKQLEDLTSSMQKHMHALQQTPISSKQPINNEQNQKKAQKLFKLAQKAYETYHLTNAHFHILNAVQQCAPFVQYLSESDQLSFKELDDKTKALIAKSAQQPQQPTVLDSAVIEKMYSYAQQLKNESPFSVQQPIRKNLGKLIRSYSQTESETLNTLIPEILKSLKELMPSDATQEYVAEEHAWIDKLQELLKKQASSAESSTEGQTSSSQINTIEQQSLKEIIEEAIQYAEKSSDDIATSITLYRLGFGPLKRLGEIANTSELKEYCAKKTTQINEAITALVRLNAKQRSQQASSSSSTSSTTTQASQTQRCARAECPQNPLKLLNCARCNQIAYCSKECQVADWPNHKPNCTDPQAEAEGLLKANEILIKACRDSGKANQALLNNFARCDALKTHLTREQRETLDKQKNMVEMSKAMWGLPLHNASSSSQPHVEQKETKQQVADEIITSEEAFKIYTKAVQQYDHCVVAEELTRTNPDFVKIWVSFQYDWCWLPYAEEFYEDGTDNEEKQLKDHENACALWAKLNGLDPKYAHVTRECFALHMALRFKVQQAKSQQKRKEALQRLVDKMNVDQKATGAHFKEAGAWLNARKSSLPTSHDRSAIPALPGVTLTGITPTTHTLNSSSSTSQAQQSTSSSTAATQPTLAELMAAARARQEAGIYAPRQAVWED